jgi:hypothetical protein
MIFKKDNPGSPCCSCECPCYPLDGDGRDYHRHLDLATSGTVAYSTVRKLGTKAAEFSGGGYLHQGENRCYSIGNGLRMWGWFRMDGMQPTQGYVQNIVSLGGYVFQSSAGAPITMTGGGGIGYYNWGGGCLISVQMTIAYQPSPGFSGINPYGRLGAWPSTNCGSPTPGAHWSFFHTTFTSTGTVTQHGAEFQTTLFADIRGSKHPAFGTDKRYPVWIGGGGPDPKFNAGSTAFGGSTTGATSVRIDNVGFSTDITNYAAKAINLFNSGNGRACPAST